MSSKSPKLGESKKGVAVLNVWELLIKIIFDHFPKRFIERTWAREKIMLIKQLFLLRGHHNVCFGYAWTVFVSNL